MHPDSPKGPPCQAPLRWPSEPTDPEVDLKLTQIAGRSGWGLDIQIWFKREKLTWNSYKQLYIILIHSNITNESNKQA